MREIRKGVWELRWSDGPDPFTGKPRKRSATVQARNITDARAELAKRKGKRRGSARLTFGELLDTALPALPIAASTRDDYARALKHLPDAVRARPAGDLGVVDARAIMEGLTARCGAQLVHKCHTAILSCWREAMLNGWVTENPWRGQRRPKVPTSAGRALTDAEVAALRSACEPGLEALWIEIHLATGARPGEPVGLRASNIDHTALLMTFIDHKHDDEPRTVAITEDLSRAIRAWQQVVREQAMSEGRRTIADPFMFAHDPEGARPWSPSYAGRFRWHRLAKRAGLDPDLRLYDLRHTHNSWLEAGGIDPTTRAARIGNSSALNQRVYSHPLRDRDAAAIAAARLA